MDVSASTIVIASQELAKFFVVVCRGIAGAFLPVGVQQRAAAAVEAHLSFRRPVASAVGAVDAHSRVVI